MEFGVENKYTALAYRDRLKSFSVLLSITQAAPGRNTRNLGKGIQPISVQNFVVPKMQFLFDFILH